MIALGCREAGGFGEFWPTCESGSNVVVDFFEFALVHSGIGGGAGEGGQAWGRAEAGGKQSMVVPAFREIQSEVVGR